MTEARLIVNFKKLFGLMCLLLRHKERNPHTNNKERNVHNKVSYTRSGEKLLMKHFTVQKLSSLNTEE